MKFYLTDTKEYKEIEVKEWEPDNSGYSPDCFGDLEPNVQSTYMYDEDKLAYICTAKQYADIKDFWEVEIAAWQSGCIGDTSDYTGYPNPNITLFAD